MKKGGCYLRREKSLEFGPRLGLNLGVQAVAVGVHRHYGRKIPRFDDPHCFRHAEVQLINAQHFLNRLRNQRGRAADRVQIHARHFLAGGQSPGAHAAFADHGLDVEVAHQIALIRLFARHRRAELLHDLTALLPLIEHLGGGEAVQETFLAMRDVAKWWP